MLVNFRIAGEVWGERVQYEPLTDVMNLLPQSLWQQEPVPLRLARQMQALCICAKELLAKYMYSVQCTTTKHQYPTLSLVRQWHSSRIT